MHILDANSIKSQSTNQQTVTKMFLVSNVVRNTEISSKALQLLPASNELTSKEMRISEDGGEVIDEKQEEERAK